MRVCRVRSISSGSRNNINKRKLKRRGRYLSRGCNGGEAGEYRRLHNARIDINMAAWNINSCEEKMLKGLDNCAHGEADVHYRARGAHLFMLKPDNHACNQIIAARTIYVPGTSLNRHLAGGSLAPAEIRRIRECSQQCVWGGACPQRQSSLPYKRHSAQPFTHHPIFRMLSRCSAWWP